MEENLQSFKRRGWKHIPNKDGSISVLRKARRIISPEEVFQISPDIRQCEVSDLPEITELFRREYPLRYRMVGCMRDQDPPANFIFEDDLLPK